MWDKLNTKEYWIKLKVTSNLRNKNFYQKEITLNSTQCKKYLFSIISKLKNFFFNFKNLKSVNKSPKVLLFYIPTYILC